MIKRRVFKVVTVALMVVMTVALVACGKKDDKSKESTTQNDIFAVGSIDEDGTAIDTDIKVDETTKAEVESEMAETTKADVANKETEKETGGQTQAPTVKPTEAPTVKPTEVPTVNPMTEDEKAVSECLKNSIVTTDKPDRVSISYIGTAEKIVVPATYTDGRPIVFFYLTSNSSVKEVVILGSNTMAQFQENHKLEKITTYANMIDSTLISTCSKIKEVNLLGDNITFIKNGFVQYHSLTYPVDFRGATLNINLKKIDDVKTCGHPVYLPEDMVAVSEYCAKYSKLVKQYGIAYTFFNWCDSENEYKSWFSKINYLK